MIYEELAKSVLKGDGDVVFEICKQQKVSFSNVYLILYGLCFDTTGLGNQFINLMPYFFTKRDITLIRSCNFDINALFKTEMLYSPEIFLFACRLNNIQLVETFLTQVEIPQEELKNGFCLSCQGGMIELVELLFSKLKNLKFDLNPLHLAIENYRIDVVQFLLKHFSPEEKSNDGQTALHVACSNEEKIEIVKLLPINNERDHFGYTPLHRAVISQQLEVVKYLSTNVDINVIDKEGRTPLWYSLANKNAKIAQALLNKNGKF